MAKIKLPIFLSLFSGLLLAFALPFYSFGWLALFALLPLLLARDLLPSKKGHFLIGSLAGLVYFAFTFRWFWDSYPLDAFGLENRGLAFVLIFTAWFLTTVTMSLFWGAATWLHYRLEKTTSWLSLLFLPATFALIEFARSFWLSLLWYAPGTLIGPHWTAGHPAYNLSASPFLRYLSSWLGIYGITFLVVFANVLLYLLFEKKSWKKLGLASFLILLAVFLPLPTVEKGASWPVAVVQTAIPSQPFYSGEEKASFLRSELELVEELAQKQPDTRLVVFPEGSNFFTGLSQVSSVSVLQNYFIRLFPQATLVVDNSKFQTAARAQSRTIFLDTQKGVLGSYNKQLLTPGGEFIPELFKTLFRLLGIEQSRLQRIEEYRAGDKTAGTLNGWPVSVLVCSDVASPNLVQKAAAEADILLIQSSFGFVSGSPDLFAQTRAMARFRAAENRKSLVFASNFAPSFMLDSAGKTVKSSDQAGFEILTADLVLNQKKTLYNKLGNRPILMASFVMLVLAFFWREKETNHV